jgi:hypothetical protein
MTVEHITQMITRTVFGFNTLDPEGSSWRKLLAREPEGRKLSPARLRAGVSGKLDFVKVWWMAPCEAERLPHLAQGFPDSIASKGN